MRGVSLYARKLPLHLLDLLLLCLLHGIPALLGHLVVDLVLHAQVLAQGIIKGAVHVLRGGFDHAVHVQVADTLGGLQQVFHDLLVVHCSASFLHQLVQLLEQLGVVLRHLLGAAFQLRVLQRLRRLLQRGGGTVGRQRLLLSFFIDQMQHFCD